MKRANLFGVFVGIESPDTAALIAMRKKQNTRAASARASTSLTQPALYLHVGPYSRDVIGRIEDMIAALEPVAAPRARIPRAGPSVAL
jgi:hypothetical protein